MDTCFLDYETRSVVSLEDHGLDRYASDPSTQVLMAAYAFGSRSPKLWQPHLEPEIPDDLHEALTSPFCTVWAWNAGFEREITRYVLGLDKPIQEWRDPMCMARALSFPGYLEEAERLLGLKPEQAKIKDGDRLIKLFTEPEDVGGYETLFGTAEPTFRNWASHPRDWALFGEYCLRDVIAERAAYRKMRKFPMSDEEWDTWFLDQRINSVGWPVDKLTVEGARAIALREMTKLTAELKDLTGLDNPNSRDQLLGFLQDQGYGFTSLNKDFVARALAGECQLTPLAREVIALRSQTSKSSVSKYTKLADMTGEDGRLRHQYTFYGAHSGRWAAHGANVGNLPKPSKAVEKNLDRAVELVRLMDYDGVVREFGKPLEVVSSVLRSAFRAPEGKKFVVADLNAIENRTLGYLARCPAILRVFQDGLDPYLAFACLMYRDSYANLLAEFEAGDKHKRTVCKAPVLGGGYALGPGKEELDSGGNKVWTGLLGYARKMNIELTREEAEQAILTLRESWPEVKMLWKDMERASAFSIRHPGHLIGVGVPQTQWEKDYFERTGRKIYDPLVYFVCHGKKVLEMKLPSNRPLYFIDPRVEVEKRVYNSREYTQDVVYHKIKDQKTKQWIETPTGTFGGRWVENACQAVARDVLVNGMKLADARGFEVVGHTYDELVTLVPTTSELGVKELCDCMTAAPPWCGDALPLGASGFEDKIYRKE